MDAPAPAPALFGPFVIGRSVATRRAVDLVTATLFLAEGTARQVALRRTRRCDDGASDAFLQRAQRYAILHHPSITPVLDLGALEGRGYVATALSAGPDLLRVLARCGQKKRGFPTDVALYVVLSVLRALGHAHGMRGRDGRSLGITHGDLRHSNVLVDEQGAVQLCDFGLDLVSTRRRTPRGIDVRAGKGFACYRAPEQVRGAPTTVASDIFGVGVLLFELVTGRVLLHGAQEQPLIDRVSRGEFAIPLARYRPDIHPGLARIIQRALAPEERARFASAQAFEDAIDALLAEVGAEAEAKYLRHFIETLFGGTNAPRDEAP